jgi:hypothetical protein
MSETHKRRKGSANPLKKNGENQEKSQRGCFWLFISFLVVAALYIMKGPVRSKFKEPVPSPYRIGKLLMPGNKLIS